MALAIAQIREYQTQLLQQREKAVAQLHAVDGALQAVEHILGLSTDEPLTVVREPDDLSGDIDDAYIVEE